MKTLADRLAIEVPRNMRYLRRDHRGYPVPFIVMWGSDGRPNFAINDSRAVAKCVKLAHCGICGKPLNRRAKDFAPEAWFVGSARCFVDPRGAFLDPAMHRECATYALQVCPYLAIRGYGGPNGEKHIAKAQAKALLDREPGVAILEAETLSNAQPEIFGLGQCYGYNVVINPGQGIVIRPDHPWVELQFWSDGRRLEPKDWVPDKPNFTIRLVQQGDVT